MTCDLLMHIVRRMHNKYELLLLPKVLRLAVGLTQPPIRCVLGINRPGREANHSPLLVQRLRLSGTLASSPSHKP